MIVLRTSYERFARFGIFQIFNLKNGFLNHAEGIPQLARRAIITLPQANHNFGEAES